MLPDFPATKTELKKAVTERLRRWVHGESTLLSTVRHFMVHEGDSFTIQRSDGTIEKSPYQEAAVEITIDKADIATFTPQALVEKIDKMAREMAEKTSKMMIERLHHISEEEGQVVDARGKPLSPDLLLEALERMDIDFDKNGKPSGLHMLVGPELWARVQAKAAEWEADPEFQRRRIEMLARKREAWRDRQSRRKLAD